MPESQLADLLLEYRKKNALSQSELADRLNVVQSYISKIERRERTISDVGFLRRVHERLSIPAELLGIASRSSGVTTDRPLEENMDDIMTIVSLAENVRSRGDPEGAISSLCKVEESLEERNSSLNNPLTTEALVRTKLTLGTALGDRLPSCDLAISIHALEQAFELCPDDRNLKIKVVRAYGNELRKNGQNTEALQHLRAARQLSPPENVNGPLAIAIARAEAQGENWSEFQRSISEAHRAVDNQTNELPLFNSHVVSEVELRGLVDRKDRQGVIGQLGASPKEPLNLATQWRVISSTTRAEAFFLVGEFDLGMQAAREALIGASALRLPQQIERLIKCLREYRKASSTIRDLYETARLTLRNVPKLSLTPHNTWR